MPMKPYPKSDTDSQGVPFSGSRIGSCGECGGHVMAGGGHPVPLPPKCAGCGATVKQPLAMQPAPKKAPPKASYAKAKGAAKAGYASLKAKKSMV